MREGSVMTFSVKRIMKAGHGMVSVSQRLGRDQQSPVCHSLDGKINIGGD